MNGNSIITNNNTGWRIDCIGGGVYNNGYFEMSGNSVITDNNAGSGGGVFNTGSFEMTGGIITNNFGGSDGGVINEGFLRLIGGVITNNTAYDLYLPHKSVNNIKCIKKLNQTLPNRLNTIHTTTYRMRITTQLTQISNSNIQRIR